MKTTTRKGRVATLRVRSTNDATLPAGIRAVAAITPTSSRKRSTTFKVYVLINNLPGSSTRNLSRRADDDLAVEADVPVATYLREKVRDAVLSGDCAALNAIGNDADGNGGPAGEPIRTGVRGLRDKNVQPSDPEAVLDHAIYNLCKDQGAEVPEDGPG